MSYLPTFVKQLDGSAYQGVNCTCASACMAADYDSLGKIRLNPNQVRIWTGDTSSGTTLGQIDQALRTHVGVDLDTQYRLSWSTFASRIDQGQGAILQGWYRPIRDSRFAGSETFGGNHAMFVPPGWGVMDPLADGRRTGIYKYHGEAYPQSLVRSFAGKLNVGGSSYKALGDGLVYASFTRDNTTTEHWRATVRPLTGDKYRVFGVYTITNGVVTGTGTARTGGFTASCTPPRLYPWAGHTSQSLVRLLDGGRAGLYIRSSFAREV